MLSEIFTKSKNEVEILSRKKETTPYMYSSQITLFPNDYEKCVIIGVDIIQMKVIVIIDMLFISAVDSIKNKMSVIYIRDR